MYASQSKRWISALFIIGMVLMLIPFAATPAFAANPVTSSVTLTTTKGNQELNSSYPFLVNNQRAASGTLGEGGCTAQFEASTGTLTLHNYNGGSIQSSTLDGARDLTVVLVGANTITNASILNLSDGDITITTPLGPQVQL